jgi:hypothetical protein
MIGRDNLIQTEFVKKTLLAPCLPPHHQPVSAAAASTKRNHCSIQISTDFCNTICQDRTLAAPQIASCFVASRRRRKRRFRTRYNIRTLMKRLIRHAILPSSDTASRVIGAVHEIRFSHCNLGINHSWNRDSSMPSSMVRCVAGTGSKSL